MNDIFKAWITRYKDNLEKRLQEIDSTISVSVVVDSTRGNFEFNVDSPYLRGKLGDFGYALESHEDKAAPFFYKMVIRTESIDMTIGEEISLGYNNLDAKKRLVSMFDSPFEPEVDRYQPALISKGTIKKAFKLASIPDDVPSLYQLFNDQLKIYKALEYLVKANLETVTAKPPL